MTKAEVERIVDRSLRRLRVECLDLVQYYWWDPDGSPGYIETGLWLDELRRAGKIARIGVSNFSTPHSSSGCSRPAFRSSRASHSTRPSIFARKASLHSRLPGARASCSSATEPSRAASSRGGLAREGRSRRGRSRTGRSPSTSSSSTTSVAGRLFQELLGAFHRIAGKHGRSVAQVALRWVLEQSQRRGRDRRRHFGASSRGERRGIRLRPRRGGSHAAVAAVTARRTGPEGDCFDLERDRDGRHGRIMRYDLNDPGA